MICRKIMIKVSCFTDTFIDKPPIESSFSRTPLSHHRLSVHPHISMRLRGKQPCGLLWPPKYWGKSTFYRTIRTIYCGSYSALQQYEFSELCRLSEHEGFWIKKPSPDRCLAQVFSKTLSLHFEARSMHLYLRTIYTGSRQDAKRLSKIWQDSVGEISQSSEDWCFPCTSNSLPWCSQSTSVCTDEGDAHRRMSFESGPDSECKSELDSFDINKSAKLRSSANLGISFRKSLSCNFPERDAPQIPEDLRPQSPAKQQQQQQCSSPRDDRATTSVLDCSTTEFDSDTEETWSGVCGPRLTRSRSNSSCYLSEGEAARELFFRLNHARQTVAFVRSQAARFSPMQRAKLTVWEALEKLGSLREYETTLMAAPGTDASLPLVEHSLQTAEACRLAFPDHDWLHLVGLIHGLGKLLGHPEIAGEPQWAICGESFPVGCRFDRAIACSQFFSVNPDRRSRLYSTSTGFYKPGGGLASVFMSWSAAEYLYMVLLLNETHLPPEALFLIRYQKFWTLQQSAAYESLMCDADRHCLGWLGTFRRLAAYSRRQLPPTALQGPALHKYYSALIRKYIPAGHLRF